jgi:molybdopterin molybdotransferase
MLEFLELLPPMQALARLLDAIQSNPIAEEVETVAALGRITHSAVLASGSLPPFSRSTVDGYALSAADTYGASESLPAYLKVSGEVSMGAAPQFSIKPGSCGLIHTGGMLPEGANAVVMVEHTQTVQPGEIEVLRAVAVGENVLKAGEDVTAGQEVITAGQRLRAPEIGGLMALGITRLAVARKPRVGILSSGDEVVAPELEPAPGQVRDVNAFTLSALVESAGGIPLRGGIIPDRAEALKDAAARVMALNDMVVITAGSSASTRDLTAQVLDEMGKPGVLVHGVNVRPGKPTILAVCDGKPMIGLPGNPVSALVIASLFVVPVIEKLLGLRQSPVRPSVPAKLTLNIASQAGREDWVAVRFLPGEQTPGGTVLAEPVFGKSNLIFTLARADGLVRIPPDATGLDQGEIVQVFLL